MKETNDERKMTMTIRLGEREIARIKRACHRDEIKPAFFAYNAIMQGLESLIKKQEKHGYQCSQPL